MNLLDAGRTHQIIARDTHVAMNNVWANNATYSTGSFYLRRKYILDIPGDLPSWEICITEKFNETLSLCIALSLSPPAVQLSFDSIRVGCEVRSTYNDCPGERQDICPKERSIGLFAPRISRGLRQKLQNPRIAAQRTTHRYSPTKVDGCLTFGCTRRVGRMRLNI